MNANCLQLLASAFKAMECTKQASINQVSKYTPFHSFNSYTNIALRECLYLLQSWVLSTNLDIFFTFTACSNMRSFIPYIGIFNRCRDTAFSKLLVSVQGSRDTMRTKSEDLLVLNKRYACLAYTDPFTGHGVQTLTRGHAFYCTVHMRPIRV